MTKTSLCAWNPERQTRTAPIAAGRRRRRHPAASRSGQAGSNKAHTMVGDRQTRAGKKAQAKAVAACMSSHGAPSAT
eukprot:366572-Chlamydomonas_euryale.AAC.7